MCSLEDLEVVWYSSSTYWADDGLFTGKVSAIRIEGSTSELFPIKSGACKDCVLVITLFNACVD